MGEKRQDMTAIVKATSESSAGLVEIINARVTYRNAPMHLLEKFTFKDIDKAHKDFLENAVLDECVILQTCNRVEIFGAAKDVQVHRLLEEWVRADRKSTRLNSSHANISYAVFCLKKKK